MCVNCGFLLPVSTALVQCVLFVAKICGQEAVCGQYHFCQVYTMSIYC